MKERLKELMSKLSVNAADLADRIGVQRSSVSHILNGRNLPSTQFIEKLLNTYPEIDARWLITGYGKILRIEEDLKSVLPVEKEKLSQVKTDHSEKEKTRESSPSRNGPGIEKILILNNDRSFMEYFPAK